jgi:hypothetical protein
MRLSKYEYVLICEETFAYFDSDYPTSGLTLTGLARVHCKWDGYVGFLEDQKRASNKMLTSAAYARLPSLELDTFRITMFTNCSADI